MDYKVGDFVVINCGSDSYFDGKYGEVVDITHDVVVVELVDDGGTLTLPKYYVKLSDKTTTRPSHYSKHTIEPIDLIVSLGLGEAFCAGNVIKYVSRYSDKNGDADLAKAEQYLKWLIQLKKTGRIEK